MKIGTREVISPGEFWMSTTFEPPVLLVHPGKPP
jgi:hypothetical protein